MAVSQLGDDLTVRYSTVKTNISKTTVRYSSPLEMFRAMQDVIPDDGYYPFYSKRLEVLGYEMFMKLVERARQVSDTPDRLFCWMLNHPELVRFDEVVR